MKELKIKLTLDGECKALARGFRKYEDMLCQTRASYNYRGIVGQYISSLAMLAEIQGRHFDQAKAYGYLRSYTKQATAQKAMKQISEVYYAGI